MSTVLANILTWMAVASYLISFGLPTIELGLENIAFGGRAFALGFWGSLVGMHGHNFNTSFSFNPPLFLLWAANPLFWCGAVLLFFSKWRSAAVVGLAATVFASALAVEALSESSKPPSPPSAPGIVTVNPDGTKKAVPAAPPVRKWDTPEGNLLVGYYIWWLSMALLGMAGFTGAWGARRNRMKTNPTIVSAA